ncbi:uncharacterized protein LOC118434538 [Folsomia candida]|uniref:Uncharacterized protein n=1 Tax=Folsomia candida TaxID=158441 RepID=A0A226ESQ7_FOLCA|nr:uncharacterized protein LOC118434538 [Folsomia candida]OXA60248.1 hypothetical protein Fcan01_04143 [Folsomia candida]
MARISNSPKVKLISTLLLILSTTFSVTKAAPSIDFNPRTASKLIFWFKGGNHEHKYTSRSSVSCDQLPDHVGQNWNSLTVRLDRGEDARAERCAILFHHRNCIDPVLTLDFSLPPSTLTREIKSFRYCHGSCDTCEGAVPTLPTTTPRPDYDAMNK